MNRSPTLSSEETNYDNIDRVVRRPSRVTPNDAELTLTMEDVAPRSYYTDLQDPSQKGRSYFEYRPKGYEPHPARRAPLILPHSHAHERTSNNHNINSHIPSPRTPEAATTWKMLPHSSSRRPPPPPLVRDGRADRYLARPFTDIPTPLEYKTSNNSITDTDRYDVDAVVVPRRMTQDSHDIAVDLIRDPDDNITFPMTLSMTERRRGSNGGTHARAAVPTGAEVDYQQQTYLEPTPRKLSGQTVQSPGTGNPYRYSNTRRQDGQGEHASYGWGIEGSAQFPYASTDDSDEGVYIGGNGKTKAKGRLTKDHRLQPPRSSHGRRSRPHSPRSPRKRSNSDGFSRPARVSSHKVQGNRYYGGTLDPDDDLDFGFGRDIDIDTQVLPSHRGSLSRNDDLKLQDGGMFPSDIDLNRLLRAAGTIVAAEVGGRVQGEKKDSRRRKRSSGSTAALPTPTPSPVPVTAEFLAQLNFPESYNGVIGGAGAGVGDIEFTCDGDGRAVVTRFNGEFIRDKRGSSSSKPKSKTSADILLSIPVPTLTAVPAVGTTAILDLHEIHPLAIPSRKRRAVDVPEDVGTVSPAIRHMSVQAHVPEEERSSPTMSTSRTVVTLHSQETQTYSPLPQPPLWTQTMMLLAAVSSSLTGGRSEKVVGQAGGVVAAGQFGIPIESAAWCAAVIGYAFSWVWLAGVLKGLIRGVSSSGSNSVTVLLAAGLFLGMAVGRCDGAAHGIAYLFSSSRGEGGHAKATREEQQQQRLGVMLQRWHYVFLAALVIDVVVMW